MNGIYQNAQVSYILVYFLKIAQLADLPWKQIIAFQKHHESALKIIPLQGAELCIPEKYIVYYAPYQFIRRKHFLNLLQHGKTSFQNSRIFTFFDALGFKDKRYRSENASIFYAMNKPIAWTQVESKLEQLNVHAVTFLEKSIANFSNYSEI